MSTTMTEKATAMSAAREFCTRVWMGSNTSHAVDLRVAKGRSVSIAGSGVAFVDVAVIDTDDATAPTTGYVYPRLEAPPV